MFDPAERAKRFRIYLECGTSASTRVAIAAGDLDIWKLPEVRVHNSLWPLSDQYLISLRNNKRNESPWRYQWTPLHRRQPVGETTLISEAMTMHRASVTLWFF